MPRCLASLCPLADRSSSPASRHSCIVAATHLLLLSSLSTLHEQTSPAVGRRCTRMGSTLAPSTGSSDSAPRISFPRISLSPRACRHLCIHRNAIILRYPIGNLQQQASSSFEFCGLQRILDVRLHVAPALNRMQQLQLDLQYASVACQNVMQVWGAEHGADEKCSTKFEVCDNLHAEGRDALALRFTAHTMRIDASLLSASAPPPAPSVPPHLPRACACDAPAAPA
jgi:hypothetical protein